MITLSKITAQKQPAALIKKVVSPITVELPSIRYAPELKQSPEFLLFKKLCQNIQKAILNPISEKEQALLKKNVNEFTNEGFEGLELTKNLDKQTLSRLISSLKSDNDLTPFLMVATGHKPAMLNGSKAAVYLQKINAKGFETVSRTINSYKNILLLNINETKNTIASHREFFAKRLNLPSDAAVEEIYLTLTGSLNPLHQKNSHDLTGILLGYPKQNSIIFNLENMSPNSPYDRKTPAILKRELKKTLYCEESPYKNFDEKFFKETEAFIDSITCVKHSKDRLFDGVQNDGYIFINFKDEPLELKKILCRYRSFLKNLMQRNEQNRINKNLKEIGSIEGCTGDFALMKDFFSMFAQ
ncbi:MAG: hypothetical protein KHX03_08575 [Clostridium sp.]|nr:hypothetical protein [Clostridium sp.]